MVGSKVDTRFGSSRANYISESGKMEVNTSRRVFPFQRWLVRGKMARATINESPMLMLSDSLPTGRLSYCESRFVPRGFSPDVCRPLHRSKVRRTFDRRG